MADITNETQEELEKKILHGISEFAKLCTHPMMIPEAANLAYQLKVEFIGYVDNARLLQNQLKENVIL